MPYPSLNRSRLIMRPLSKRYNRVLVQRDFIASTQPSSLDAAARRRVAECAARIRRARRRQRPVIMAFGAHTIKNGLGPLLIQLMQDGWLTHLATNGAGIIHDWEFAYQGASGEEVKKNVARGEFGNWEETGFYINLALNIGAYAGLGYGEAIGALIQRERLRVPARSHLHKQATALLRRQPQQAAAAAELLAVLKTHPIRAGLRRIPHPWKKISVQAAAYRLGIPCSGHPMIGHDIIYNHPLNNCALLGRAAQRDLLTFASSVSRIQDGVYLSIGSAIMSPMIFEKAMSMGQNLARQRGRRITGHYIFVVDLAPSDWDWRQGEPPENQPAYYQRFHKSFSRMGGSLRYLSADNRDFLLALSQELRKR